MPEVGPQRGGDATTGFGWLCPTESHRARMLDMGPRVRRARMIEMPALGLVMVVAIAIGALAWATLALFAVALVNLWTLERRMRRAGRPERVAAGSLCLMIVLMGCAAVMTGGAVSPVLAWLVIPVAMTAVRFRAQVVWAAAGVAGLVAVLVAVTDGAQRAIDHPLNLLSALVLVVAVTAVTTALMDAELQFRDESVLDPLTELLNRTGLEARFAEVGERARLLDRPVCLIMYDLDRFKQINDTHGHECGDAVLRETSFEMRKSLRSFELLYRVGGEEFLVLLPGIDLRQGVDVAESMRAALEDSRPGGLAVTASFGVSAASGEGIEFLALYRAADDAMYRAKRAGRNMVVASGMRSRARQQAPPMLEPAALAHA